MAPPRARSQVLLALLAVASPAVARRIELRTTCRIVGTSCSSLTQFLATPANWPRIVASSWAVEGDAVGKPMRRGARVDEIFGAPPILPLRVAWQCERMDAARGELDVRSSAGLAGVAEDCRMRFVVQPTPAAVMRAGNVGAAQPGATVDLRMSYTPTSPLAVLAIPILAADNWLALNVLLPMAVGPPLVRFRLLMGSLYLVAGLSHLADCLLGESALLRAAGAPAFAELGPAGQAVALAWCAAGPLSFALAIAGEAFADAGLVAYGVIEVAAAALASGTAAASSAAATATASEQDMSTLIAAVGVQALVASSWAYAAGSNEQ